MSATVTLQIPDLIYQRLVNTAHATGRALEEVTLHPQGGPPDWQNAPNEFKADLAALNRLEDEVLWQLATGQKTAEAMEQYNELLERNQTHSLTEAEQLELMELRSQADRFMLRKAQAAALLHWRGHHVPNS